MKAKRIVDGEMKNPYFSAEKRREAIAAGKPYDVKPFLTLPAGEIVDHPDCFKLCVGDEAVMVPVDDECRAAVMAELGSAKRTAFLRNLRTQNQPDVRKQMSKGQQEWLDEMLAAYGSELDKLDAKPAPEVKAPVTKKPEN